MHVRPTRPVRSRAALVCLFLALVGLVLTAVLTALTVPAFASTPPAVEGISSHYGAWYGGKQITVRGANFTGARAVLFGRKYGWGLDVLSDSKLTVYVPEHSYDKVYVRVVTSSGTSARTADDKFTFTHATMNSPIWGGLTARQEQHISAQVRAAHHGVRPARASRSWTPAMGVTAVQRARSWLGLPYSWAGGNGGGPTFGVCAHNGGDMDCHVIGFDCSGLALYAWAPYESLVHLASTQHHQAGQFHPGIGELMPGDLVFFSGYIADGIGHVAVYAGNGMVIEAAESGTLLRRSPLVDVIADSGVYRGATRPMSTGQQGPVPHLSSVTGEVPASGGLVTLTGTDLRGATSVSVDGQLIYSFVHRSATHLVVKAPPHPAGTVPVAVSTAWGTAQRAVTYVDAPAATSLSPAHGPVTGGNAVTIHGSALSTVTTVTVGTKSVAFTVVSPTRLTLTMPAHDAGSVPITLYSPFGTAAGTSYTYVVREPKPTPTPISTPTPTSTATPTISPSATPPVHAAPGHRHTAR